PAESLYRIDVIKGKPTASAELIASNIRKAGHTLRVELDEQNLRATATVYRADDPEFPHTVTRDMTWAKRMGLANKENYKKQPLTVLPPRATAAVGRLACPEALYGVQYPPDELNDIPDRPRAAARPAQPAEGTVIPEAPAFEAITAEQWNELLAAGHTASMPPAHVAALAAQIVGAEISGIHEIPAESYETILQAIRAGEVA